MVSKWQALPSKPKETYTSRLVVEKPYLKRTMISYQPTINLYEQSVVKEETQKEYSIGPGTSPEGEAIFERLMRDPEAAALMQAEIAKARKERGLYLNSLGELKAKQQAEEQALQDQANERALANEQREQERRDQIRLDLANARRADERAEIIRGDSF